VQETTSALSVLRRAIRNEIAGQRFYTDAAHHCIDPWAKEIFASLAEEEESHTRLLLSEHEALSTQGRWLSAEAALANDADIDAAILTLPAAEASPSDELFPAQQPASQRIDRMGDDLAALEFAIHLEQQAIDLYGREAAQASEPAAQEAFRFLAEEEVRHLKELRDHWEKLAGRAFAKD
jgi:rubrerythrin